MAVGESNEREVCHAHGDRQVGVWPEEGCLYSGAMRALRGAIAAAVFAFSCGPTGSTSNIVGPTGGEVCLTDDRVCILIPPGALDDSKNIYITPTNDVPGGAITNGYEIGPSGTKFLKSAKVTFKIEELFAADSGVDPTLLRLYTRYEGDWEPLGTPVAPLDRVRRTLSGSVAHLSPFVVLRIDRLPDGGDPTEIDGGKKDGGTIIVPYFDAGRPDAGKPDAGVPDSGTPDAGKPDAGVPDAGKPDAGQPDAGQPDSGVPDSGTPDAGKPDAGVDAGVDAGIDAGVDAGVDAGIDAGVDAGVDGGSDAGDGG